MGIIYDPPQLDAELRAAGLVIHGCSSDGRVDFVNPPSPTDIATANGVKAAHDPTKRDRDDAADRTAIRDVINDILASTIDTATWNGISASQRSELARRGLRALAMLIRRVIQR